MDKRANQKRVTPGVGGQRVELLTEMSEVLEHLVGLGEPKV